MPLSGNDGGFDVFMAARVPADRLVVIVADGDVDGGRLLASMAARSADAVPPMLIAADGAAAKVIAVGLMPDLVVGDGDSLSADVGERLRSSGIEMRLADPDKDESDTELCLLAALDAEATSLRIFGALGGTRPEHSVANLLLLADPRLDGLDMEVIAGAARIMRIGTEHGHGQISIVGDAGDFVSLLPLAGPVDGVRTTGLRFPLDHERLEVGPARGLSNELVGERAAVESDRGRLLVIHTARSADRTGDMA